MTQFDPRRPRTEPAWASGVNLLDRVDLFNLLCVPGETTPAVVSQLQAYCRRHRAMLIADCAEMDDFTALKGWPWMLSP